SEPLDPALRELPGPADPAPKGPLGPADPAPKGPLGPADPAPKGPLGPADPAPKGPLGPADPAPKGPLGPLVYPIPFPRHLPRPSRGRLAARAAQTAGVFTGTLGGAGLRKAVGRADPLVFAQAMRRAFESLGAT